MSKAPIGKTVRHVETGRLAKIVRINAASIRIKWEDTEESETIKGLGLPDFKDASNVE